MRQALITLVLILAAILSIQPVLASHNSSVVTIKGKFRGVAGVAVIGNCVGAPVSYEDNEFSFQVPKGTKFCVRASDVAGFIKTATHSRIEPEPASYEGQVAGVSCRQRSAVCLNDEESFDLSSDSSFDFKYQKDETKFLVKSYLVYPADKPMYPEYERTVKKYMRDLQKWYEDKVGEEFEMASLQVKRSQFNYDIMRCDPNPFDANPPSSDCLNNPKRLDGNWGMYMNLAIHDGVERWEEQTSALVFSAGGGGFAGANLYPNYAGWAITGDWVLEPLSGVANSWGIPCSLSDGWQCAGGVPGGTPAHELGHAFGLPHPDETLYPGQSIMRWHGDYPEVGFFPHEVVLLKQSPFFTGIIPSPSPAATPSQSPSASATASPNSPVCTKLEQAPRGSGVILSGNTTSVTPGQAVSIVASIIRDDGNRSNIIWNTTGGSFSSSSWDLANWKAPITSGTYTVSMQIYGVEQPNCIATFSVQ